jgi:type I restriction enzyme, S subunit
MKKDWELKTLGEVCDLMTGGTPSRTHPEYFNEGNIRWLVSGDIHKKEIFDCKGRITQAGYDNSSARFLPVDSVLIALNGQGKTRGTVALLRTEATCNQSLVSINPKDKKVLSSEYLFRALDGRYEEIRKLTGDAGNERRGLNMPILRSIKIAVPPLDEQKRIVGVLDKKFETIEELKKITEQQIVDVKELFESRLNEVFENKSYEKLPLGDLIQVKHGYAFKGQYFNKKTGDILLTPGNFAENEGLYFTEKNTKRYSGEIPSDFILKNEDLVIVMTDLSSLCKILGSPAFVEERMLHNQRIGKIELDEEKLLKRFLYFFFLTKAYKELVKKTATGTTVRHTAPVRIYNCQIILPELKEQNKIVNELNLLLQKVKAMEAVYKQKIANLDELKKSYLEQAFAGKL